MDTKRILAELKSERGRIDAAITALEALAGGSAPAAPVAQPAPVAKTRRGRKLTAAGRKKLSDNMKKRWAERKKAAAKK
jgi:hypothetical protein